MNTKIIRPILIVVLILFSILTGIALWVDGLTGILPSIVSSWMSMQIFIDLVIAVSMICVWMWRDAKATGRNPWPWIIAAFIVGCFSPLLYLLTKESFE